jgi:hypothetical protein
MTDLSDIERRLRHLEDERDIARLIASYGPLVDAGDAEHVPTFRLIHPFVGGVRHRRDARRTLSAPPGDPRSAG